MTELASRIQTTRSAVSQFESGRTRPSAETITRLGLALRVPASHFTLEPPPPIDPGSCHFRQRRSTTATERRRILANGSLWLDLFRSLEDHVNFPDVAIPTMPAQDWSARRATEDLAARVRDAWQLAEGPIENLTALLEDQGVLVLEAPGHSEKLDAFSAWVDGRPVVFVATEKNSASRRRWDLAHELGHLLMHPAADAGNPQREREADAFAGAFLLPWAPFLAEYPRRLNWPHLFELKQRWGVSLAALVKHAYDLGLYSEATYRRAFSQLSRRGWRRAEPNEPSMERPVMLNEALRMLLDAGHSLSHLAGQVGRHPAELEEHLRVDQSTGSLSLFS
jgi:Zn-dependent peptidase ImmA (M78 family)